ncbi:MAG: hypothetical protein VB051_06895, partial [Candidatus Pelethousia sp.]|nr:hypothetical protein [Candidatus Pelethousia sp.]
SSFSMASATCGSVLRIRSNWVILFSPFDMRISLGCYASRAWAEAEKNYLISFQRGTHRFYYR